MGPFNFMKLRASSHTAFSLLQEIMLQNLVLQVEDSLCHQSAFGQ